jgi:ankyrin repeat protein
MGVEDALLLAAAEHESDYEDEFEDAEDRDIAGRRGRDQEGEKSMSLKQAARVLDREDEFDTRESLRSATEHQSRSQGEHAQRSPADRDVSIADKMHRADAKVEELPDEELRREETKLEDPESELDESDDEESVYEDAQDFMFCCYHRRVDSVYRHLEKGASICARDRHGWTPIHWACAKGYDDILEALLKEYRGNVKRCINERDSLTGFTPLHLACVGGHVECIKILLDHNAKRIKNNFGELPSDVLSVSILSALGKKIGKLLGVKVAEDYDIESKSSNRKRK